MLEEVLSQLGREQVFLHIKEQTPYLVGIIYMKHMQNAEFTLKGTMDLWISRYYLSRQESRLWDIPIRIASTVIGNPNPLGGKKWLQIK